MRFMIPLFFSFSLLFLSLMPPSAHAVMGGAAEVAKLAELIDLAKQRLRKLKDSLDELQATNDTLVKAKDTLRDIQKEYEFASNFDPEQELKQLTDEFKDDFGNLYSIKEFLSEDDDRKRFDLFLDEMDKRLKRVDDNVDDGAVTSLKKRRQALAALKEHYAEYAVSGKTKELTQKDLSFITASSTAILAEDVLEKKQKAVERQILIQENRIRELEHQQDMLQFFMGGS